jgi:hypothetical protein
MDSARQSSLFEIRKSNAFCGIPCARAIQPWKLPDFRGRCSPPTILRSLAATGGRRGVDRYGHCDRLRFRAGMVRHRRSASLLKPDTFLRRGGLADARGAGAVQQQPEIEQRRTLEGALSLICYSSLVSRTMLTGYCRERPGKGTPLNAEEVPAVLETFVAQVR